MIKFSGSKNPTAAFTRSNVTNSSDALFPRKESSHLRFLFPNSNEKLCLYSQNNF